MQTTIINCIIEVCYLFMWAQLGSNQRPPDYESGGMADQYKK
jgi:hypothetical protein